MFFSEKGCALVICIIVRLYYDKTRTQFSSSFPVSERTRLSGQWVNVLRICMRKSVLIVNCVSRSRECTSLLASIMRRDNRRYPLYLSLSVSLFFLSFFSRGCSCFAISFAATIVSEILIDKNFRLLRAAIALCNYHRERNWRI